MRAIENSFWLQLSLAIFVSFLAITYFSSPTLFFPTGIMGDLAADMLHGEALNRGEWLTTGHYSRFKFNHPGPFFFYWNLPFELALEPYVGRLKAWLWGSVVLNSILVGASATALTRYFVPGGALGLSGAIALLMSTLMGADLGVVWLPTRIEAPFLAFLIALLWLAGRDLRALAPTVALLGILVHGYITMVLLALPLVFVAFALARSATMPWPSRLDVQRAVLSAAFVGSVFLLPLLVELFKLPDGNFGAILAALDAAQQSGSAGWGDLRHAINGILAPQAAALLLFSLATLFASYSITQIKAAGARLSVIAVLGVSTFATTLLAYWGTPTPVPLHIMLHFRPLASLVAATVIIICFLGLSARKRGRRTAVALGLSLGFVAMLSLPDFMPTRVFPGDAPRNYPPQPWIDQAAAHLAETGGAITISFVDNAKWEEVAGMLVWLIDRDIRACTTRLDMAFLFTNSGVCEDGTIPRFEVVSESACNGLCSFSQNGLAIIRTHAP